MIKEIAISAFAILLLAVTASFAQDNTTGAGQTETPASTAPASDESSISLELNKLEDSDKGCRAYVVVSNPSAKAFDAYKLDLVMFQKDGVIGRRFALDLAPLRPSKRSVKLFELDGTKCEDIGSFLVNDVMECRSDGGAADDCLARMKVNSLTKVEISK